jgi:hypothetical protein
MMRRLMTVVVTTMLAEKLLTATAEARGDSGRVGGFGGGHMSGLGGGATSVPSEAIASAASVGPRRPR